MESFLKDKRTIYAIVLSVIIGVLGYCYYEFFLMSTLRENKVIEEKIRLKKLERTRILRQVKRHDALRDDVKSAQRDLAKLKQMFPDQERVPLRLNDLYKVIRTSGVKITGFKPIKSGEATSLLPDDPKFHYRENIYKVKLETGYHMLGELFEGLANLGYPISLRNVRINQFSGLKQELNKSLQHGWIPTTISVEFDLITYSSRGIR